MWDSIFQYISEQAPLLLFVIAASWVACWITWKVRGIYERSKKVEAKVQTLPCEQHESDLSIIKQNSKDVEEKVNILPCEQHQADLAAFKRSNQRLDDISSSIRKIEEWILRMDIEAMNDLVRKCSPYQLTETGKALLLKSQAKECVDKHLEELLRALEETNPQTAYDVERNALSVLSDKTDDKMFNDVKNFIYISPAQLEFKTVDGKSNATINMQRILMVMSIYLRDKYFEKHQEIDRSGFLPTFE